MICSFCKTFFKTPEEYETVIHSCKFILKNKFIKVYVQQLKDKFIYRFDVEPVNMPFSCLYSINFYESRGRIQVFFNADNDINLDINLDDLPWIKSNSLEEFILEILLFK